MTALRVLDLFSGIGGFSLGLERAGFRTVAFCEIDPFCRAVLAKHWPEVPCYDDVRTLTAERLRADGIAVDVICGGFPCQDISVAGKGAGIDGERSGLWSEYARLVGELRPRFVIVENVAALLGRGLERVLGDLAALGYDAEWHCIPASAIGAPHRRDRLWIVAHTGDRGHGKHVQSVGELGRGAAADLGRHGEAQPVADADEHPRFARWLSDAIEGERRRNAGRGGFGEHVPDAASKRNDDGRRIECESGSAETGRFGHWLAEPDVGRVAHGVPNRVDRLRALGNAVVPQIPELIGRAVLAQAKLLFERGAA